MPIGDKFRCGDCGYEYTAVNERETHNCKNASCKGPGTNLVVIESKDAIILEPSILDGLEKKDDVIEKALHKLEFKEIEEEKEVRDFNSKLAENARRKEEKKMAEKDKESWGGTAVADYDPQVEFKSILKDMGLRNKIESIAKMFFAGDIDNPHHLDQCLKTASVDKARRRLAIASYYGHIPDEMKSELEVDVGDGDDDFSKKSKNSKGKEADPLKDFYNEQKRKKAEKLMELTADMEIEELKATLEKKSERMNAKNDKSVSDTIRMPATDADGNVLKDEKGAPVIMEMSKADLPYYLMTKGDRKPKDSGDSIYKDMLLQQNAQIAKLQEMMLTKATESAKPDEKAIAERKYWEEKAERERQERDKLMVEFNKQRQESIADMYKMREDFMKRDMVELSETLKAVNKPIGVQLNELKAQGQLAQSVGLIPTGTDPKTAVQTEIARGIGEESKALVKEFRDAARQGMQEGMSMVKEERQKAKGIQSTVSDIAIPQSDKDAVYAKLLAKMEEEKRHLDEERGRIAQAKADLDAKSNELIQKWEKLNIPQQSPPSPPSPPPPEQPKPTVEEIVREMGVVPTPDKPVETPAPEPPKPEPQVYPQPEIVSVAVVEDPIEKKLKEMESKKEQ